MEEAVKKLNKKVLSRRAKDNIFIAGMLLIPVVHFIIFWGAVNFNSIFMAFFRLDTIKGTYYHTWNNFKLLGMHWESGVLKEAFLNTFLTWVFLVFLLPWAFFLAYFLYKRIRFTALWRTVLFVPTILPVIAMTSVFKYIVGYYDGPVGKLWQFFGAEPLQFLAEPSLARWTVIFYIFWTNFGGQFILMTSAMARVPKEVVESAYLDGAGMRVEMLSILLPLCWPTISMLTLLNLAGFFTVSGPILLLTNGQAKTGTISFFIFDIIFRGSNYNEPSALGLILTAALLPIVLLARWGMGKVYAGVEY